MHESNGNSGSNKEMHVVLKWRREMISRRVGRVGGADVCNNLSKETLLYNSRYC